LDVYGGYCAGWSLRRLLEEGLNGVPGKVESNPPRHLSAALGQIVNFLGTMQNEWAGAQAFSSFDTYLAPFVRIDRLTHDDVYQGRPERLFSRNVASRCRPQTPFPNLALDWAPPADRAEQAPLAGGEQCEFTNGGLQAEMHLINRPFMEVITEGDA